LWSKNISTKAARKMLMKLTTALCCSQFHQKKPKKHKSNSKWEKAAKTLLYKKAAHKIVG